MIEVLADPSLYDYTGGEIPSLKLLEERYAAQAVRHSADGSQWWLNLVVIKRDIGRPVGCRPSRCLTMAASSPVTMPGCEKAPPVVSGGAFVVMVTWWSSVVMRTYSLFSVIADCAAARSTIALSAA